MGHTLLHPHWLRFEKEKDSVYSEPISRPLDVHLGRRRYAVVALSSNRLTRAQAVLTAIFATSTEKEIERA